MIQAYFARSLSKFFYSSNFSIEELTQEVLLAVHLKRHTYQPENRFLPWLYAIAKHKFIDRLRSERSQLKFLRRYLEESSQEVFESTVEHHLDAQCVINSLEGDQRTIIQMVKIEERSVAETSELTGLTESNVKTLTHRGMSQLKEKFGEIPGKEPHE